MKKWLVVLGVVIIVVLALLWRELESSDAAPVVTAPAAPVQVAARPKAEVKPAEAKPVADEPAKPPASDKMDPSSDEFFREHDEVVIPNMMRQAVKCWENLPEAKRAEFHRN